MFCSNNDSIKSFIIDNHNLSKNIINVDVNSYYDDFNIIYKKYLNKIKLFKYMKELLLTNKKIVIITSNYEKFVRQILINNEINNSIVVIGKEMNITKSNRLNLYIKINNINRDDIIYIGDTYDDYLFCKKEKIKMIGVNYGYSNLEKVKNELINLFYNDYDLCKYIMEVIEFHDNN